MRNILLVAGDPSGDLHGADLIRALRETDPSLRVFAVGGSLMRKEADEFLFDLSSMGIVGFIEPLRRMSLLFKLLRRIKTVLREHNPLVVCIDYYGFNRWVLAAAKREGLSAYYYISPQVWASRRGRLKSLKSLVHKMLVIFPFEEEFYREAEIPVRFVGHPLLDRMPPFHSNGNSPEEGPLRIGLLPGSREGEVRRHLPVFLDAVDLVRKDFPSLKAEVFASSHLPDSAYAQALRRGIGLVRETDYRRRAGLSLVLTSSGTATLENALLGLPMVVVYKMSWPTYAIARGLIRVNHIAMANILSGKSLVPELIQGQATAARVARAALDLLAQPRRLAQLRKDLAGLRNILGGPGAAKRAAGIILEEATPSPRQVNPA